MICVSAPNGLLTRADITRTLVNMEFFKIFTKPSQIDWHLHANLWVKIPNIHRSRISGLFRKVENSQKVSTLKPQEMANRWRIQKSNPGYLEYPVHTCGLIFDQISECRVPSKLPQMCQKNGTFVFNAPPDAPSVLHPPKNGTTI